MARIKLPVYGADFETTVNIKRTRVWLWGIVNFGSNRFEYGTTIESFLERISRISCKVYFHNVKFDIQFILYHLLKNGYKHTSDRNLRPGYLNTLISDMGMFYTIKVCFDNGETVTFIDSYKLIPLPIEKIPKAFGLNLRKLDLDYEAVREDDHVPTQKEIDYLEADVRILTEGVKAMHNMGLTKLTSASNALANYRNVITRKEFESKFPALTMTEDYDCRLSYKGGWSYLNPKYKDKLIGKGKVYDVNSMYPWAMRYCRLPYGSPVYYNGEYKPNKVYPLYIQCLTCRFKLKAGKYPSIQLKGNMRFGETEYIEDSSDEAQVMTLTSVDLELLFENYHVWDIEYIGGYMFKAMRGLFDSYIDYWYDVKNKSKSEGNDALYYIAKLMLNSLYGKFGTNPRKRSKYPVYDVEKDIVRYELMAPEISTGGYVPVAAFITSYARDKIIRAANACGDRFVYADTDSIHIIGEDAPDIEIDSFRLGAFKEESIFDQAKFHRSKCYIEAFGETLDKKCAGLPKAARDLFTFDTMEVGSIFEGKLVPINVPGGQVLVNRAFTIK